MINIKFLKLMVLINMMITLRWTPNIISDIYHLNLTMLEKLVNCLLC